MTGSNIINPSAAVQTQSAERLFQWYRTGEVYSVTLPRWFFIGAKHFLTISGSDKSPKCYERISSPIFAHPTQHPRAFFVGVFGVEEGAERIADKMGVDLQHLSCPTGKTERGKT